MNVSSPSYRARILFFFFAFVVALSVAAQEPSQPRIAILVVREPGVSQTLEGVVRESVALQLERYAFEIEQLDLEDLPESEEARYRVAERNGYDFVLLAEVQLAEQQLEYAFTFIQVAEQREISYAEGATAIGFTLDRVLQTVVYEVLERGIAALVRPVEFAEAEKADDDVGVSVSGARPSGFRAVVLGSAFVPTGEVADYVQPMTGTAVFLGYTTPDGGFAAGLGTGLYRGRVTGEAIDARSVFLPFGFENRYLIGSGTFSGVVTFSIGGMVVGVVTETRGEEWEVVPWVDAGAAVRFDPHGRTALIAGVWWGTGVDDTVMISAIRPSLGVEFGL